MAGVDCIQEAMHQERQRMSLKQGKACVGNLVLAVEGLILVQQVHNLFGMLSAASLFAACHRMLHFEMLQCAVLGRDTLSKPY